jgi:hypothetical protein
MSRFGDQPSQIPETSLDYMHSPPKMQIRKFGSSDPEDVVIAQFNPSEFEESVAPKWARLAPQGLSHEVRQFISTGPYAIKLTLFWMVRSVGELQEAHRDRRRLLSWANPSKVSAALGGAASGPATLLLIWPGMLSLRCDLISVKLKHQMFNREARATVFNADCEFEEQRSTFLSSEGVAVNSGQRLGSP